MSLQHRIELSLTLSIALLTACSSAINVGAQITNTPAPTITPTVITMDQNVEAFLSGEFDDVNNLSLEERKEFSILLAQKMNEARGARPLIYNKEAYVDPITGMMKDYDGHPDLEETIQMYLAVALDDEGDLLIQNEEGIWEKINGSKGIDWNMVVTDPNDPRIDWPTGNENSDGMSPPNKAVSKDVILIPVVRLDNSVNQLYVSGENASMQPTITFIKITTDSSGIPIFARKLVAMSVYFQLFKEGSSFFTDQNMLDSLADGFEKTKTDSPFFKKLRNKQVYYMSLRDNQPISFEAGARITPIDIDYENVVAIDDVYQVLTNQKLDNLNMAVFMTALIVESIN